MHTGCLSYSMCVVYKMSVLPVCGWYTVSVVYVYLHHVISQCPDVYYVLWHLALVSLDRGGGVSKVKHL